MPSWMVIVIVSREFIISGFRLVGADNGRVIAASYWGKIKTVSQMVMICLIIADIPNTFMNYLTFIFLWASLILTIISLVDYLIKNKEVMKEQS